MPSSPMRQFFGADDRVTMKAAAGARWRGAKNCNKGSFMGSPTSSSSSSPSRAVDGGSSARRRSAFASAACCWGSTTRAKRSALPNSGARSPSVSATSSAHSAARSAAAFFSAAYSVALTSTRGAFMAARSGENRRRARDKARKDCLKSVATPWIGVLENPGTRAARG